MSFTPQVTSPQKPPSPRKLSRLPKKKSSPKSPSSATSLSNSANAVSPGRMSSEAPMTSSEKLLRMPTLKLSVC